jgi:glycogen debranching enzyme
MSKHTLAHVRAEQRYAWRGPSLLVTTLQGECEERDLLSGYYFREARHLRTLRLLINGDTPWLCAEATAGHDELVFAYVYPELRSFGGGGTDVSDDTTWKDDHGVTQRGVDVRLRHRVDVASLETTVAVANRTTERIELTVTWVLGADFADIQEALSGTREQRADVVCEPVGAGLRFKYLHDRLPLETAVAAGGAGEWRAGDGELRARLRLESCRSAEFTLRVMPVDPATPVPDGAEAERRARHLARWRETRTSILLTAEAPVVRAVQQAADDLGTFALLEGSEDEWLALQAGFPLYPALFGRDTLTAGWQAALLDRGAILDASLTRLGRMQSDRMLDWSDEEPGRLPYQVRQGPLARLAINPYRAYYADYASPLMYVISLANLYAWTGERRTLARHWDSVRRILDWAREYGDRDGDGYLEYLTRSPKGTKNQGWKDSGNAVVYEDGRPVPAPLGTCELQGYWFAAQQLMAVMSWAMGERDNAKAFWRSAMKLKARFNRDWWLPKERFFALAMDADKRLAESVTSNVGHCLATGIVADEHVPPVVGRLFAPDMFSGWGIRTLSTAHPAYNPVAYHLGTVWPVENATIAFGLRRYGFDQRAVELARSLFDLAALYDGGRVPECVGGYGRAEFSHPGAYPRANPLQAWNQSAIPLLLHTLLGLQPVAALDLLVVDPVLPGWLSEVTLENLRIGGATATIRFERDRRSGRSHGEVVRKRGTLRVLHQPPPESLRDGVRERVGALITSLIHH